MAIRTYDQPDDIPYFMDAPISGDAALSGDLQRRFDTSVYPEVGIVVEALGNPNSPQPIPGAVSDPTAPPKMLADTDFRIANTLPGPGSPVGGSLHSFGSSFCLRRTSDGLGLLPGQRLGNMVFDAKRKNITATFLITGDGSAGDSITFYVGDASSSGQHILLGVGAAGASWRLGAAGAPDAVSGSHALSPTPERLVQITLVDRAVTIAVDGVALVDGVTLPASVTEIGRLMEVEFQNDGTEPNMYIKRMIVTESVGLPVPQPPTNPGPGANAALFLANLSSATPVDATLPDPTVGSWAWQPGAANLHTDNQGMWLTTDGGSVACWGAPFTPKTGGTELSLTVVAPAEGWTWFTLIGANSSQDNISVNPFAENALGVSITANGLSVVSNEVLTLSAAGVTIPADSAGTYRLVVTQNLVDATVTVKVNDTVVKTYTEVYFAAPVDSVRMNPNSDADTGVRYETLAAYGITGTPKPKPKPVYNGSNVPERGTDIVMSAWNFAHPGGLVTDVGAPTVGDMNRADTSLGRDEQGLLILQPATLDGNTTSGQISESVWLNSGLRLTLDYVVAAGYDALDGINITIYDRDYAKHLSLDVNGGFGIQGVLTYGGHNNNAFTENGNAGLRVPSLTVGEHTLVLTLHNAWTWEATLDGAPLGSGDLIEWGGWGDQGTCAVYIAKQTNFADANAADPLRIKSVSFAQI